MQPLKPEEIVAHQITDLLREVKPKAAVVACLMACAGIAKVNGINRDVVDVMHLVADLVECDEAVDPVETQ